MKGKMLVVVAILLGVVAVFLVNSQMGELEKKANPPTKAYFKARVDVAPAPGLTVREAIEGKVKYFEVRDTIPESFASSYKDAIEQGQLALWADRPIARPIRAGAFLTQADLTPDPIAIPEGHVVAAIAVSQETAVGFQIAPGDIVDVYLTRARQDPKAAGGQVADAEAVLSGVTVYATGDLVLSAAADAPRVKPKTYPTVTLLLTEAQAPKLIAAQALGRLTLVLKKLKPS